MNANFHRICGLYGRTLQLLTSARIACEDAYKANKTEIKKYEECLAYANKRMELCEQWARSAQLELHHWKERALAAEAELFNIKINQP
jgi:hypothetical protein